MNPIDYSASILVVEDYPIQQMVIRILCERYGLAVSMVSSGREAIKAVQVHDGCYDAILMDCKMSEMDGFDTARAIRKIEAAQGRHTPIIAVTAKAMVGDREQCLNAGMDDYMSKPFTAEEFRAMLLHWTHNAARTNLKLLPGYKHGLVDEPDPIPPKLIA
jgi:two-component system, sensor histidine kinase and response regulator